MIHLRPHQLVLLAGISIGGIVLVLFTFKRIAGEPISSSGSELADPKLVPVESLEHQDNDLTGGLQLREEEVSHLSPEESPTLESMAEQTSAELGAMSELDALVTSFRGDNPLLDQLNDTVRNLGDGARLIEDSVYRSGKVVGGELELEGVDANAQFKIDGDHIGITLPLAGAADQPNKSLYVTFTSNGGIVQEGFVGVQHHLEANPAELKALSSEPVIVGWTMNTDPKAGTTVRPLLCKLMPNESSVRVGRLGEIGDALTEARPWDWDLSKFGGWYAAVAPLMDN